MLLQVSSGCMRRRAPVGNIVSAWPRWLAFHNLALVLHSVLQVSSTCMLTETKLHTLSYACYCHTQTMEMSPCSAGQRTTRQLALGLSTLRPSSPPPNAPLKDLPSIPLTRMPQQRGQLLGAEEDWTGVASTAVRRRIQNRINQRACR